MSRLPWIQFLDFALSAFFLVGFVINTFAVELVSPKYRSWGYPDRFHLVSGGLDLVLALLLLRYVTRPFGVALGCSTMFVFADMRRLDSPIAVGQRCAARLSAADP